MARKSYPDLAAGISDAAALSHIASCHSCAAELRIFHAVLDAAADYASADMPDPGKDYWERFLPSVRARLILPRATTRAHAGFSIRAAAAALLMAAAAVGALLLPRPAILPDRSVVEANSRLEKVLLKRPELAPELAGDWAEEGVWAIIDGLSREQTARLRAEIAAEEG